MGRFYQTTEQEFLDPDKMVYNPNYDLALKMIMHKEQQYKELEAVADSIYNIQFNHLNSKEDEETARIQRQYFQEKADDLARQLQADPNNLSNIQAKLKGLQREFTESKTRGQIADLENSYNAYHNWNKENSKLCEENPALCQAMRNEAMKNWGGDSLKRTWSQEKMAKGLDRKSFEEAVQKMVADIEHDLAYKDEGYIYKIYGTEKKHLTKDRILNYAINRILSDPDNMNYLSQANRVGIARYFDENGKFDPFITTKQKYKDPKTGKEEEVEVQTLNPENSLTSFLNSLGSFAYSQEQKTLNLKDDSADLENLKHANAKAMEKYKKDLENVSDFRGSQAISEKLFDENNFEQVYNKLVNTPDNELKPVELLNKQNLIRTYKDSLYGNLKLNSEQTKSMLKNLDIDPVKLMEIENRKRNGKGTAEDDDYLEKVKDKLHKRSLYEKQIEKEYNNLPYVNNGKYDENVEKAKEIAFRKYKHLRDKGFVNTNDLMVKRDKDGNVIDVIDKESFYYNSVYGNDKQFLTGRNIGSKRKDFEENFKNYVINSPELSNVTIDSYYHTLNPQSKDGKQNIDYKFLQEIHTAMTLKEGYTTYDENGKLRTSTLDLEIEDGVFDTKVENYDDLLRALKISDLAQGVQQGKISVSRLNGSDGHSEFLRISLLNRDGSSDGGVDLGNPVVKLKVSNYKNNYQQIRDKDINFQVENGILNPATGFFQTAVGQRMNATISGITRSLLLNKINVQEKVTHNMLPELPNNTTIVFDKKKDKYGNKYVTYHFEVGGEVLKDKEGKMLEIYNDNETDTTFNIYQILKSIKY